MKRTAFLSVLTLCVSGLVAPPLASQPDRAARLDEAARLSVVESAATILREAYVFPDIGDEAASTIETALADGRYAQLELPAAFAERLTTDLQAVAGDKHLRVSAPGLSIGPPPAAPPPRPGVGVARADILIGDVGYLEVDGFPASSAFNEPLATAMTELAESRALIVDMRRNGGGSPVTVAHLISYFIDSDGPVLINTIFNRIRGTESFRAQQYWSEPVSAPYTARPVLILTSSATFSGGEAFAYDMQAMGLARVVGEVTGGGANPGTSVGLSAGIAIFVPGGRAENPITGSNWEGVGVEPDIITSSERALAVALEQLGLSPAGTEIEDVSVSQVFAPGAVRGTPQPGAVAALRRISAEAAAGMPDYDLLSPLMADAFRTNLSVMQEQFAALGAIESITFVRVSPAGADVYDVQYRNGGLRWTIALADGITEMAAAEPIPASR